MQYMGLGGCSADLFSAGAAASYPGDGNTASAFL